MNKSLRIFLILSYDIFLILLASNIAYFIRLEKLDANNLILKYLFIYSVIYLFIFFIFKLKDLSHRYFSLSHTKQLLFPFICLFLIWGISYLFSNNWISEIFGCAYIFNIFDMLYLFKSFNI